MRKLLDLIGKKFGRLVVIRQENSNQNKKSRWLCKCDCGKKTIIIGSNLKNGHTQSCGCLHIKHGHSTTTKISKTYLSWGNMIQRCTNPNEKQYKDYGGRGITVCKRWMKFENFLEDMGERPKGHQIDRINNNDNYCKSNCRWATRKEQMRNKRNNRTILFNRKTQCVAAWAEEYGINDGTLRARLNNGWSIKKTLITPVRKRKK